MDFASQRGEGTTSFKTTVLGITPPRKLLNLFPHKPKELRIEQSMESSRKVYWWTSTETSKIPSRFIACTRHLEKDSGNVFFFLSSFPFPSFFLSFPPPDLPLSLVFPFIHSHFYCRDITTFPNQGERGQWVSFGVWPAGSGQEQYWRHGSQGDTVSPGTAPHGGLLSRCSLLLAWGRICLVWQHQDLCSARYFELFISQE